MNKGLPDIHVIPENDLQVHIESDQCWCHPFRDLKERRVVVHNSADGREIEEWENEWMNAPMGRA